MSSHHPQSSPSAIRAVALLLTVMTIAAVSGGALDHALAGEPSTSANRQGTQQAAVSGVQAPAAGPDWNAPHAGGQMLIKMVHGSLPAAGSLLLQYGAHLLRTIPQLDLAVAEVPQDRSLSALATRLSQERLVEWSEPNYTVALDFTPDDPYYVSPQAGYLGHLDLTDAWNYTTGKPSIVVAIVDTGVDISHDDLAMGIWTNEGEIPGNGIDDDGNGYVDDVHGWNFPDDNNVIDDDYGHGTHVAGIAAARINNSIGIAGIAGNVTIMPVDIFPSSAYGTYEDLIRAMIYATDNGARVINLSLGATSYSRGEQAAVDYAWSHDVVVVAAAGNSGRNNYHYPAAHKHAIAVAATDAADNRANFSTYGDFVSVAAPGVSIWSTYRGNRYANMSGTSMATPHVSGLAALIFSMNPTLKPDEVRALIQDNADDLGAPGWDPYYGYGRINAGRTLARVPLNGTPSPTPTPHPPLAEWPAGCQDLIADGSFEGGLGDWQASESVQVDNTRAFSGTLAAHFPGGPDSRGVLTHTVTLPSYPLEATLWFAYRIENEDLGWGSTPQAPYDDWFTAELRGSDGHVITSLLRTGNSADTATEGLPWDRYLYRMQTVDLGELQTGGGVNLVFSAGNDRDNLPTDFWVDSVRFCVTGGHGTILPLIIK